MGHTNAVLSSSTGETYEVLRADIGCEDGHTDYIPGFALTEQIVLRVGTLHLFFVFLDGAIDRPHNGTDSDSEYYPVEP